MVLSPGARLGAYEVIALIGAGGMGEVYRARDPRLERTVAIKVLPEARSADAEHRERFRREALALSRLSHPNICAVFDVGTQDGTDYLVLELLEGETLAERLERGPMTSAAALEIGRSILSALERTHGMGLAHRDLKPSNIMLTRSGAKLLDFGLARFILPSNESSSLTVSKALTDQGAVLGTFQYMSPEALEGHEADARSDLFSFGAVLYEMVTGRRAFRGDSPASVIGAILKEDPPSIVDVDASAPLQLDRVIRSCLAKDPDERWQNAHDLRLELQWSAEMLGPSRGRAVSRTSRLAPWFAVTAVALLAALLVFRGFGRGPVQRSAVRALIYPPEAAQFVSVGSQAGPPVLSFDGRRLAFVATSSEGRSVLWVRSLGALKAQAIAGTEGASYPFWSPDGGHLGFFADQKLKKVALDGGAVTVLCDALYGAGGAWGRGDIIVFAGNSPGGLQAGGLQRIAAAGGAAVAVTTLNRERQESSHRWPAFLADGRRFVYAVGHESKEGRWTIHIASLDSDATGVLVEADSNALYADGSLLFARGGTLFVQALDRSSTRLIGEAVPIAADVLRDAVLGRAVFSVSDDGTLVFQTGAAASGSRLVWFDRSGVEVGTLGEPGFYIWPRLSPDGERAAIAVTDPRTGNTDIWIHDLADGRKRQLTFSAAPEANPTWGREGNRVFFTTGRRGVSDIYQTDSRGGGAEEALLESDAMTRVQSASPDGRYLIFARREGLGPSQLWLLSLTGEGKPRPLLGGDNNYLFGEISPDGHWLVYQSNESGKNEVYVTAFPSCVGKWRVSQDGGILPRWSADGREIFYVTQDHAAIFSASVSVERGTFQAMGVRRLFSVPMVAGRGYPYDVSRDGQRFLVVVSSGAAATPLTLVLDWDADLRR